MPHHLPVWLIAIGFHLVALPQSSRSQSAYSHDVPQPKQEVETRIRPSEFPAQASEWIAPVLGEARRIRHYLQTDGVDTTYEIKFKIDGRAWSVEFQEDGVLQDAERVTSARTLPNAARTHLDTRFKSWKAVRVQTQHLPDPNVPARVAWFRSPGAPVGYEVEVEGRNPDEVGLFELQFDADVRLLQERRIIEIRFRD